MWQPIETAPRDGTKFLAYSATSSDYMAVMEHYYTENGDGWWASIDSDGVESRLFNPTHWTPLPEPPK